MNKQKLVPRNVLTDWEKIDQGCFGCVYKAKHSQLKITVAVKILKENASNCVKELLSEVKKMDSASVSPYVIHLIGMLEEDPNVPGKNPGIVMEFMEYGSLHTLMEKVNVIPWAFKFRILHEVAVGMNWLHTMSPPLLHLDLKTKNILINDDLHIKITDFGLSKYTSGSSICRPEDCEEIGGTLEYMPPEAFQEGYQPHKSTDVYSFAILSVVVLTGEEPYKANISVLIRRCVPEGQRPSVTSLENNSSVKSLNEAVQFIVKCWDNDRLKRPSFSECCIQWEKFKSAYNKQEIKSAVREVQDIMDSPEKTTEDTHSKGPELGSIGTTEMEAMISHFPEMQITENPSIAQQAVPVTSSQSQHTMPPHQHFPKPDQPSSNQRPPQPPINRGSNSQGYQYGFPRNFQNYFPRHAYHPPPSQYPTSTYNMNINNCTGPIQVGDNNVMYAIPRQHRHTNVGLVNSRPGQSTTRRFTGPARTRPLQTTHPQTTRPARGAASPIDHQTIQNLPAQANSGPEQGPVRNSSDT